MASSSGSSARLGTTMSAGDRSWSRVRSWGTATQRRPAALAAATPLPESSTARASAGATPRASQAAR